MCSHLSGHPTELLVLGTLNEAEKPHTTSRVVQHLRDDDDDDDPLFARCTHKAAEKSPQLLRIYFCTIFRPSSPEKGTLLRCLGESRDFVCKREARVRKGRWEQQCRAAALCLLAVLAASNARIINEIPFRGLTRIRPTFVP